MNSFLLAQNLGEYGALAGGASALQRFLDAADRAVRNPRRGAPAVVVVILGLLPAAPALTAGPLRVSRVTILWIALPTCGRWRGRHSR